MDNKANWIKFERKNEIMKKGGIFFPIALFAPYVVVFGRKSRI